MSKVYIFQPSDYLVSYYRFMIEQIDNTLDIQGIKGIQEFAQDEAELMDKLFNAKLVVVNFELPKAEILVDKILSCGQPISTIVTFKDEQLLEDYKRTKSYCSNVELFAYTASPFNFSSSVEKLFKYQMRRTAGGVQYMQIKVDNFLLFQEASVDIFVKLNDQKFVKILRRFENYTVADIQKYQAKGVKEFFVKSNEYQIFMQQVLNLKMQRAKQLLELEQESPLVPATCHEAVYEMINSVGIDENCVKIAGQALNKTIQLMEKSSLASLLADLLQNNAYISEHSMMVSFLAGGICRNSAWFSHENLLRLSVAAFFHDIKCSDEKVARIATLDDFEVKELNNTQFKMLESHIIEATKLVQDIGGIPAGVDKILLSHHEKYDGSGFPRRLDYKLIDPLSAIFIVAHEMVDLFYRVGFYRDNIFEVLTHMKQNYVRGPFPKIVDGLIVALGAKNFF